MNIISFAAASGFDFDIIENKYVKEELDSILSSVFSRFKFSKSIKSTNEYKNNICIYDVDAINGKTISQIINKKMEGNKSKIIDTDKSSKSVFATFNDIPYIVRCIYDKKRNTYSICANVANPVGVLHRYFGDTYKIEYDATRDYLEFCSCCLLEDDKYITKRHRYISDKSNLTLVSYEKTYDAFVMHSLEKDSINYPEKYSDIYYDGNFSLEDKIDSITSKIYISDKTSRFPTSIAKGVMSCNGLVVYDNTDNKMSYEGIITCFDSIYSDTYSRFKNTPLHKKEDMLIKNYNLRKDVNERVKKLSK